MEFKGTKGEWYVVGSEPAEIATDKKSICFVGIQDYFNKDIEQRANAKLIAAAPELLDALLETDKDLCILWAQMLELEETNPRAEGLSDLIKSWRDRNKKAINKALK